MLHRRVGPPVLVDGELNLALATLLEVGRHR
jgi:hypothetical protein